jgi:hypothetical protein
MSKNYLINRLKWYYPMERLHAFVTFPALMLYVIYTNPLKDILFLLYGLMLCIIILFQGQHYWKLKLHKLLRKDIDQERSLTFFRKSKKLNLIMIGLIPAMFAIHLSFNHWNLKMDNWFFWGCVANLFGFLEHVNYYNRQLMIDNASDLNYVIRNRKLKIASLAKDLSENEI